MKTGLVLKLIYKFFFNTVSYYDIAYSKKNIREQIEYTEIVKYENFYHGLFLGLFIQIDEQYLIKSNQEYGLGRPDLVLLPYDKKRTAVIFQFKVVKASEKETPEESAQEALDQCDKKKYANMPVA